MLITRAVAGRLSALPKAAAAPREASSPGFGGGALAWGKYGQRLYAGGTDGSLCVFRS